MIRAFSLLGLLVCVATPLYAAPPVHYGLYEHIRLDELGKTFKAKMDTGASTASLSAKDIRRFERDGEAWVRFRLAIDGADETLYEHRLVRISKIKTRAEEQDPDDDPEEERSLDAARRPVIETEICIGRQRSLIEINLTDRSHFRYPLLIGAKAIRTLDAAIDPSRKYTAGRPEC